MARSRVVAGHRLRRFHIGGLVGMVLRLPELIQILESCPVNTTQVIQGYYFLSINTFLDGIQLFAMYLLYRAQYIARK